MRLAAAAALVYQSSDQEVCVSLSGHLSLRSYWSWEACEPDSEGCFLLCFTLDIKYLMSNICRNPVRIWRNDYQSLFSVRGKWFWDSVKTGLGSWWQIGISGSCSYLLRGCKAWAGSAASSLLLLPPQAPCCKLCGPVQGCVTPNLMSPQPVVLWLLVLWWYWWNTTLSSGLWLPDCDLPALWFVMHSVKLSSHLLWLLGYLCFWVGELFSWVLFSHEQSKQGQCNDIEQLQQLILLNLLYEIHKRPKCGHSGKGAS